MTARGAFTFGSPSMSPCQLLLLSWCNAMPQGIYEFKVESVEEVQLVKEFMLRIAPEIVHTGMRSDSPPAECAKRTLYWSMHLVSAYKAFSHEALKTLEEGIGQKAEAEPNLQQAAHDISYGAQSLRNLRQSSSDPDTPSGWPNR